MFTKKSLFLFLALLLPVLVFIFLREYGENQFDVPYLYADGVPARPAGCEFDYGIPYTVPDSVWSMIATGRPKLVLVRYGGRHSTLDQVTAEIENAGVSVVDGDSVGGQPDKVKKCFLLLKEPANLVLIDEKRNIRGYYVSGGRDELDRLKTEVDIILKRY